MSKEGLKFISEYIYGRLMKTFRILPDYNAAPVRA
jgi:hypothetical protein